MRAFASGRYITYLPNLEVWIAHPGHTCWGWGGGIFSFNHRGGNKFISCPLPGFPIARQHVGIVATVVGEIALFLLHIHCRRHEKKEEIWDNSQKQKCFHDFASLKPFLHLPKMMLMESEVPSSLGKLSCESWSIFDHLRLKLSHVMHAIFNIIFYVYLTLFSLITPGLIWNNRRGMKSWMIDNIHTCIRMNNEFDQNTNSQWYEYWIINGLNQFASKKRSHNRFSSNIISYFILNMVCLSKTRILLFLERVWLWEIFLQKIFTIRVFEEMHLMNYQTGIANLKTKISHDDLMWI